MLRRPQSSRNSKGASATASRTRRCWRRRSRMPACAGQRASARDNERLEFLGDRVLGLAVAEILSDAHPKASEGELARIYNRLVRGETCARVAREIDLGAHLILSGSEADSGGRDKETILADAMRGAARRRLSRRWLREGAPPGPPSVGIPTIRSARQRDAMPSRRCRNGRRGRVCRCPSMWRSRARAQTMRRTSRPKCASRAASRRTARVRQTGGGTGGCNGAAGARRRDQGGGQWLKQDFHQYRAPTRCGFIAIHRRAERRQVDAGQHAGRRQSDDRQSQGADDAGTYSRHRHRGREPTRLHRYAGHFPSQTPTRSRHGGCCLGWGTAMPTSLH